SPRTVVFPEPIEPEIISTFTRTFIRISFHKYGRRLDLARHSGWTIPAEHRALRPPDESASRGCHLEGALPAEVAEVAGGTAARSAPGPGSSLTRFQRSRFAFRDRGFCGRVMALGWRAGGGAVLS